MLTAQQMKYEAKLQFEDIASNNAPSFTDREWSVLLTNAQAKVVYEIYKKGLDADEESRTIIQSLIRHWTTTVVVPTFEVLPSSYKVALPNDYMYSSLEYAKTTVNGHARVVQIEYDTYMANLNNPFKKPSKDKIWRLVGYSSISGENLVKNTLLISPFKINEYLCMYIARPKPIITADLTGDPIETIGAVQYQNARNCELHPNVHRRIVSVAVELAHAAVMDPNGYQLQRIESQRI
jgi:hypothetical protein